MCSWLRWNSTAKERWAELMVACWLWNASAGGAEAVEIQHSESVDWNEFLHLINQMVPRTTRINAEDLLNPENENNCIEEVSDEALVAQIPENVDDPDRIKSIVENNDVAHPPPSFKKQLAAFHWRNANGCEIFTMLRAPFVCILLHFSELCAKSVATPLSRRRLTDCFSKVLQLVLPAIW